MIDGVEDNDNTINSLERLLDSDPSLHNRSTLPPESETRSRKSGRFVRLGETVGRRVVEVEGATACGAS